MTHTRYILHRLAGALGISQRNKRLNDIAIETHLLREAEIHLGQAIWNRVEPIEDLCNEYWSLRKLDIEHKQLSELANEHQDEIEKVQTERSRLYNQQRSDRSTQLGQKREKILKDIERWSTEREKISQEARQVRRLFEGMKTQIEVIKLENETDPDRLDKVKQRRSELNKRFETITQKNKALKERMDHGNQELEKIESELEVLSAKSRERAAETSMIINQTNSKLSKMRGQFRIVEYSMRNLQGKIGHHISLHAAHDPACREAAAPRQGLVEIMSALRQSIVLNQRLCGID